MQTQGTGGHVDTVEQSFGKSPKGVAARWNEELRLAGKNDHDWIHRATKVVRRYRDERNATQKGESKYNILWSNTETIKPALYYRTPKPLVDRRNKERTDNEANKAARSGAMVLERALDYTIDDFDFDALMMCLVEDYQLPGRAVGKVNYNPVFKKQRMEAEPSGYEPQDPILEEGTGEMLEQPARPTYDDGVEFDDDGAYTMEDVVEWESADVSYVYWKDFRHGKGKTWEDVPWVAFAVDMSRDDLHARFDDVLGSDVVDKIPLNRISTEINKDVLDDTVLDLFRRARVWEIWCKTTGQVYWICTDYDDGPLEQSDPPLKFRNFFPCSRPLTMIANNGEHEPIPEFAMYQDQAREMDNLTMRIDLLLDALRVAGVYDASNEGVKMLLTGTNENKLIPVSNWSMFAEKGGVKGAISWLPIEQVIQVVTSLYEARDRVKQEMYEITGIADIVRGASNPNETASAQQIKGRFASMRLQDKQKKVARCARELIQLLGEVIAENFSKETLEAMTGMQIEDDVYELLQSDSMRRFNVSIETDSTIQPNEREEQDARIKFLTAASRFTKEAVAVGQVAPELTGMMGQLLLFGVRSFRVGRDLEDEFEATVDALKKRMTQQAQQGGKQPDPKAVEAQGKHQARVLDMQLKQKEHQQDTQHKEQDHQQDMQHKQQEHSLDMTIKSQEDQTSG